MYLSSHPLDKYKLAINELSNVNLVQFESIRGHLDENREFQDKEFIVAGLVTGAEVRQTKTGKTFCNLTLEDYNGSYTFSLFSTEYEKYMAYCKPNTALLLRFVSKKRFAKKSDDGAAKEGNEYSMRLSGIVLLDNAVEKFIPEFHILVREEQITEELRKNLLATIKKHKGNSRLYVDVVFRHDGKEDSVSFFSQKRFVYPSCELCDALAALSIPSSVKTAVRFADQ